MVKKLLKKSSKSNVSRKNTNKNNKKSKRSSKRSSKTLSKRKFVKKMKGGDAGRYVMPPSYYGSGNAGYFADGSPELETSSKQHAVSQGMVWDNGKFAGPNLYPTMTGAGCGCGRKYKTHIKKNKHTKKTKKHSKK